MAVGSRILILDENSEKISDILSMYGYDTEVAANSQDVINKLFSNNKKYDLILLNDYDNNGWNTLKTIRNNNSYSIIPIMLLTSQDDENRQVTALRIGADDCLSIPFAVPNLLARIEALLRRISWQNQYITKHDDKSSIISVSNVKLTQREAEILRMVSEGYSNGSIADKLVLKEVTVKTHLNNIFKKFKVTNRMQAVLAAQKFNIIK